LRTIIPISGDNKNLDRELQQNQKDLHGWSMAKWYNVKQRGDVFKVFMGMTERN
jgi:hypothetical protein